MSTAEQAWQEWRQTHAIPHWDGHGFTEALFKSAYRRGLKDAAADHSPERSTGDVMRDLRAGLRAALTPEGTE